MLNLEFIVCVPICAMAEVESLRIEENNILLDNKGCFCNLGKSINFRHEYQQNCKVAILNLFTTAVTSPSQRPKQRLRTSTAHLPGPKVKQQTLKKVNSNYDVGWGLKGNHHSDKLPQKLDGADIPPTPPNNAKKIWYFLDTWPELCKGIFWKRRFSSANSGFKLFETHLTGRENVTFH